MVKKHSADISETTKTFKDMAENVGKQWKNIQAEVEIGLNKQRIRDAMRELKHWKRNAIATYAGLTGVATLNGVYNGMKEREARQVPRPKTASLEDEFKKTYVAAKMLEKKTKRIPAIYAASAMGGIASGTLLSSFINKKLNKDTRREIPVPKSSRKKEAAAVQDAFKFDDLRRVAKAMAGEEIPKLKRSIRNTKLLMPVVFGGAAAGTAGAGTLSAYLKYKSEHPAFSDSVPRVKKAAIDIDATLDEMAALEHKLRHLKLISAGVGLAGATAGGIASHYINKKLFKDKKSVSVPKPKTKTAGEGFSMGDMNKRLGEFERALNDANRSMYLSMIIPAAIGVGGAAGTYYSLKHMTRKNYPGKIAKKLRGGQRKTAAKGPTPMDLYQAKAFLKATKWPIYGAIAGAPVGLGLYALDRVRKWTPKRLHKSIVTNMTVATPAAINAKVIVPKRKKTASVAEAVSEAAEMPLTRWGKALVYSAPVAAGALTAKTVYSDLRNHRLMQNARVYQKNPKTFKELHNIDRDLRNGKITTEQAYNKLKQLGVRV